MPGSIDALFMQFDNVTFADKMGITRKTNAVKVSSWHRANLGAQEGSTRTA